MPQPSDWDEPYSRDDFLFGEEPNRLLASEVRRLRPGMRALAVGDGEGRNGVWLAEHGLNVLSLDLSEVGLNKARTLAERRRVPITTQQIDVRRYDWPPQAYDLIVSIFVHFEPHDRHAIHAGMFRSLRTGGTLILIAFGSKQSLMGTGGPKRAELYYLKEELLHDFSCLRSEVLENVECDLSEGAAHNGRAHVIRFIGSKR